MCDVLVLPDLSTDIAIGTSGEYFFWWVKDPYQRFMPHVRKYADEIGLELSLREGTESDERFLEGSRFPERVAYTRKLIRSII